MRSTRWDGRFAVTDRVLEWIFRSPARCNESGGGPPVNIAPTVPLISIGPPPVEWSCMIRILIIGATGNVGRQVLSQLPATGVRVRALVRSPHTAGLPPHVDVVRG